jgi:type I restriction enzyme S subunit
MAWASIEFPKTLEKTKVGRENQILSSDIKPFGRFPVIDQGQGFIAGYSDEENKVIHDELPLVIFGDHTRSIKYVDFPFILGADGTKVLKPNRELFDAKFFYYALMSLDIPNRGYNRYFSLLKEKNIPRPRKDEQRTIASVLGLVQQAIEQQERLIALTTELKKSLMHKLFTEGLRGERQKQTEIGSVPESWEIVPLGALAKIGNGSTPKRDKKAYWENGSVPWLTSAKIHERFITQADEFVTELAVNECHLPRVKPGSLLIAITGQGKTLGNSALVSFATCISQHLAYAQFHTDKVIPEFLLWYMQTRYQHLRSVSQAGGSTKGALTCGYLKTYPVPVPSLDEQREIAQVFGVLDQKERGHERRRQALTDLFRTLLHQLMTAQIRVHDVDLSFLEQEAKPTMAGELSLQCGEGSR